MKSIWVFAWGVLKKWWALMSCAAFTVLGVVSAYSSHGSKWTIAGTFGLTVAFGFVGVFQLWSEEHQRANRAEQQLAQERENPRVTSRDWQELAEKFEVACPHVRANYQVGTRIPYDFWTLSGDSRNTCEAWIKKGGVMLLKSPQVCAQLPRAAGSPPVKPSRRSRPSSSVVVVTAAFRLRVSVPGSVQRGWRLRGGNGGRFCGPDRFNSRARTHGANNFS